ncbi:LPS-assembly lipoprotein LptE [mine drainage metagenome]|uniref:LPS-assembly lipoprotein LptE n=1 Tax=mine drainage metagenome TaxID=410659 RepID=A0A1J5Q1H3_9ZZZZ
MMAASFTHSAGTPGWSRCRVGLMLVMALALLVGGCGFKLRGSQDFAFTRIAITPNPGGDVAQELRRSLGGAVQVLGADVPLKQAQVVLQVLDEQREKVVVGVNASGQVVELELRLRVQFRLTTPQGKELMAQDSILQQRDISYNESAALAKETEEAALYRDMQTDIVQQLLRRLAALKPIQ